MGKTRSVISEGLRAEIVALDRATHRPPIEVRIVKIVDIKVQNRFRKDLGDIEGLAASIKEVGLINPITVLSDLTLVAGGRRLEAIKQMGQEEIAVRIIDSLLDITVVQQMERDENTQRKDFNPSELLAIMEELLPKAEKAANERKKTGKKVEPVGLSPQGQSSALELEPVGLSPQGQKGRATEQVAAVAGTSAKTIQRLKNIKEKGSIDLIEAVKRGDVSIAQADDMIRGKKGSGNRKEQVQGSHLEQEWELNSGTTIRFVITLPNGQSLTDEDTKEFFERFSQFTKQ